jgi:aminopeptidase N
MPCSASSAAGACPSRRKGRSISATASAHSRAGRIFRALVYNKGAAVLHMLRRLVGDQAFFNGLRRFYAEQKFQKAGTDDFQQAMEAESGQSLTRFFARWIHGADLPVLRYSSTVRTGEVIVRLIRTAR